MTAPDSPPYAFGPFVLDVRERRLSRDGQPVPLTAKALDLLQALVENRGHLLHKDELFRLVWPDAVVEENNLTVTISALRKALGEGPTDRGYIETVPRRGYRFVAEVHRVIDAGPAAAIPPAGKAPAGRPAPRPGRARPLLAAVTLVVAAAAAAWVRTRPAPAPGMAPVRSVAVLPFRSLTDDGEHLSLGMADALLTRLAGTRLLRVRSTGSAQRYAAPGVDPVAVGRALEVDSVLEGSIQTSGDRLRTTVRLLRVSDGSTVWAGTFDERLTDIFSVQDSISERMAEALALQLTDDERGAPRRPTSDSEAYQLYLRGRFFWDKRTRDGFERGIAYFRQAVEKDPAYALAYSGLADSHIGSTYYHYAAPRASMPLAKAAALKALEIDGSLAEAQVSLAHVMTNYDWEWAEADRLFKEALARRPDYARAHQWYGSHYLTPRARLDEAIAEVRQARRIEPLSAVFNAFVGATLFFAGRHDEAIEECRKTIDLHPDFGVAHWYLGRAYLRTGRRKEALAELRQAVTLSGGSPLMKGTLGAGQAVAGDRPAAEATLRELEALRAEGYASAVDFAVIHAALGDRESAFRWLDRAAEERAFHLVYLKVWPELEPLRGDPRFAALVRRIGLD